MGGGELEVLLIFGAILEWATPRPLPLRSAQGKLGPSLHNNCRCTLAFAKVREIIIIVMTRDL
jgi:hypothetical protein